VFGGRDRPVRKVGGFSVEQSTSDPDHIQNKANTHRRLSRCVIDSVPEFEGL
jgi:hypothetical protein